MATTKTIEVKELTAREGYYLTQSAEVEDRVYITAIKGANVNEADWREATEDEKVAYEKAQEEAVKATVTTDNE